MKRDGPYIGPFQVRWPYLHKNHPHCPAGCGEPMGTWLEDTRTGDCLWTDDLSCPEDMILGRDLDVFVHALNAEVEKSAAAERARIVAWLRSGFRYSANAQEDYVAFADDLADAIERGDP